MFGLFGNPVWEQKMAKRAQQERVERCKAQPVQPWSEDLVWQKYLHIDASTWDPWVLFDVRTLHKGWAATALLMKDGGGVVSPNKQWRYAHTQFPANDTLDVYVKKGNVGKVLFTAPVLIPVLHQFRGWASERWNLWMSSTPQEFLSQRPGIRFAKGAVTVAGMGSGWFLSRVAQRKQVKSVLLIEKDEELVDWLWPIIRQKMGEEAAAKVTVRCADLWETKGSHEGDALLIDIDDSLGNSWTQERAKKMFERAYKRVWTWAAWV